MHFVKGLANYIKYVSNKNLCDQFSKKKKKLRDHIISDHDFMTTYINFKKKNLKKNQIMEEKKSWHVCLHLPTHAWHGITRVIVGNNIIQTHKLSSSQV